MKRAILIVLDACGIGAMPDWETYNDPPGANTLANVASACGGLNLPHLSSLGLGRLHPLEGVSEEMTRNSLWGKAAEVAQGKDTTTGHWEMSGLTPDKVFPVYPEGFPQEIVGKFVKLTGCERVIGNIPASGTAIIEQFGAEHLQTGWPILYTSADSVFQLAAHDGKVPLRTLYDWCEVARNILIGEHEVSRVIARPFTGQSGSFVRLSEARKDYAVKPHGETVLSFLETRGVETVSVGKIADIFCGQGVSRRLPGKSNAACSKEIAELLSERPEQRQFIFANLVETDSHYGHRNDPIGFGSALEMIDASLGDWLKLLNEDDLLILTADHGCDPTVPGTDHTREYVPVLIYSPSFLSSRKLGTLHTFADCSATVCDWLGENLVSSHSQLCGRSCLQVL